MATHLHRLGAWAFTNRRRVVLGWAAAIIATIAAAVTFGGTTNERFEVPGTESQAAQHLLETKYPAAGGAQARMVFAAPQGRTLRDPAARQAIRASLAEVARGRRVDAVSDPFRTMSADGTVAFADVVYPVPVADLSDGVKADLEQSGAPARAAGLRVEWSGGVVQTEAASGAEALGLLVAFAVLAITLASLLSAGLPLLTAAVGVLIGSTVITALTKAIDISSTAPVLAVMVGLAVGIDYALFILSRHRENLGDGMTPRDAAAAASATAGSAVIFAGATVIIALAGLAVLGIPFLTVMGVAAAGTVAVAVLVALTLIPALLGFMGPRAAARNRALAPRRRDNRATMSVRHAGFVVRHPKSILIAGTLLLVVIAIPAAGMRLGLPDDGARSADTTERRAYDLLTRGFGPGFNGPLTIVVHAREVPPAARARVAAEVSRTLEGFPGVAAVSAPSHDPSGDLTVVQVTPASGPSARATEDLVDALRAKAANVKQTTGIDAFVTGNTALTIDTSAAIAARLPAYLALVVGLALLLLAVVFRSILVPLKALAGFLLSIGAALGATVWVFQNGHLADLLGVAQTGPVASFLPVLLIGILFGLAMDYEVFLVSGMREAYNRTGAARTSIVEGFGRSGRVVIAGALIMIAVFGAYVLDPDPVVKSIGASLAFGVLADALLVRLTLVPAAMALLGDRAWQLPKWVRRLPPGHRVGGKHVDIDEPPVAPSRATTM